MGCPFWKTVLLSISLCGLAESVENTSVVLPSREGSKNHTCSCSNGGICSDSFNCICPREWTGSHCEDRYVCLSGPCHNGSTCLPRQDTAGGYTCKCMAGYSGSTCETFVPKTDDDDTVHPSESWSATTWLTWGETSPQRITQFPRTSVTTQHSLTSHNISLPASIFGCPLEGLLNGTISLHSSAFIHVDWTGHHNNHLPLYNDSSLGVCRLMHNSLPDGKYCVLRQLTDTCPWTMTPGHIEVYRDDLNGPQICFHYCCSQARLNPRDVVNLSRKENSGWNSFYLLPLQGAECQKIRDYGVTKETIILSRNTTFNFHVNKSEITAAYTEDNDKLEFEFCYYEEAWPMGEYNLLKTKYDPGCPSNELFDATEHMKVPHYTKGGRSHIVTVGVYQDIGMCHRRTMKTGVQWPPGRYCLFSGNGTQNCPSPQFQSESQNIQVGFHLDFCCRDDPTGKPIALPTDEPFYLLPNHHQCQQVNHMEVEMEELYFDLNLNETFIETIPLVKRETNKVALQLCYYDIIDQDKLGFLGAIISPTVGILIIAITCCCCWRYCRRRRNKRSGGRPLVTESTRSSTLSLDIPMQEKKKSPLQIGSLLKMILDAESQMTVYGLLIHPDKLEMLDKVGKGAFGIVFQGRYRPDNNPLHIQEVAIKTLKDNCVYPEISAFMEEATVMAQFNHVNVLCIVGVCVKPETEVPMIVLPYMQHGDLQKYLRQFRYDDDMKNKIPELTQLLSFSLHIARGMAYLANMKVVHRDLAARNCMLDSRMVVKVADFGLSRDIYASSYYRQDKNKLLPIKWMALESLQDRVFTSYTDVWSYGVTVWEIFTLGKVPYPNLDNGQVLLELETGMRLNKPDTCPDTTYELVLDCWLENPKERPDFTRISRVIEETLTGLCGYLDLDMQTKPVSDLTAGIICTPSQLPTLENNPPDQISYADYRELIAKQNQMA